MLGRHSFSQWLYATFAWFYNSKNIVRYVRYKLFRIYMLLLQGDRDNFCNKKYYMPTPKTCYKHSSPHSWNFLHAASENSVSFQRKIL